MGVPLGRAELVRSLVQSSPLDPNPSGTSAEPRQLHPQRGSNCIPYGSGKAALRDGLATAANGKAVVVPAYLPDAVVEPIHELGFEVRYHAITTTLGPDIDDLERRLGPDVAAVVSVNYFGFPSPGFEVVGSMAADVGALHVEDNAHGAFSVVDEKPLGTRGEFGFTSLRKVLPVPDGGFLHLNDPALKAQFRHSGLAGVDNRPDAADLSFILRTLTAGPPGRQGRLHRYLSKIHPSNGAVPGPERRYEASKRQLSSLTAAVLTASNPQAIRRRRRANFERWAGTLESHRGLTPLFETLPAGVCPQSFPVRADDPDWLRRELARAGLDDVHTWPRLAAPVRADPSYACSRRLAGTVLLLPVDQRLVPESIDRVGRQIDHRASSPSHPSP